MWQVYAECESFRASMSRRLMELSVMGVLSYSSVLVLLSSLCYLYDQVTVLVRIQMHQRMSHLETVRNICKDSKSSSLMNLFVLPKLLLVSH